MFPPALPCVAVPPVELVELHHPQPLHQFQAVTVLSPHQLAPRPQPFTVILENIESPQFVCVLGVTDVHLHSSHPAPTVTV